MGYSGSFERNVAVTEPTQDSRAFPYEGKEELIQRFDRANSVFGRRRWDEDFAFFDTSYAGVRHRAFPHPTAAEKMHYAFDYACHVTLRAILDEYLAEIRNATLQALIGELSEAERIPGDLVGLSEHHQNTVRQPYAWVDKTAEDLRDLSPEELSDALKEYARLVLVGVAAIGVTATQPLWHYSGDPERDRMMAQPPNAVILAVETDNGFFTGNQLLSSSSTAWRYTKAAFVSLVLARLIASLGYHVFPSRNDTALPIPYAVSAGIGAVGRNGLLITRSAGARVRLATIFTDMPLHHDRPDVELVERLHKVCVTCGRCSEACPTEAISKDEHPTYAGNSISSNSGFLRYYIDTERCLSQWYRSGMNCSNCISVCPFSGKGCIPDEVPPMADDE